MRGRIKAQTVPGGTRPYPATNCGERECLCPLRRAWYVLCFVVLDPSYLEGPEELGVDQPPVGVGGDNLVQRHKDRRRLDGAVHLWNGVPL